MPMITFVKFVTVPVSDQQRALDFYTNKLGFKIVTDQPFGKDRRWIELKVGSGDTRLVLFTSPGQESQIGGFATFTFACDNVQKTYDELKAKGVEFVQEPKTEHWGTSAIMKDADGNTIVLGTK
jgi:catechol 2,3-dioxygenase-like lactoylglutathione lyase family enzyme